jgi:hypothetical protein
MAALIGNIKSLDLSGIDLRMENLRKVSAFKLMPIFYGLESALLPAKSRVPSPHHTRLRWLTTITAMSDV